MVGINTVVAVAALAPTTTVASMASKDDGGSPTGGAGVGAGAGIDAECVMLRPMLLLSSWVEDAVNERVDETGGAISFVHDFDSLLSPLCDIVCDCGCDAVLVDVREAATVHVTVGVAQSA
jgi:hypothetical protein